MVFSWLTGRRRNKILQQEFPAAWTKILEDNVAAYELLDANEQHRLRQLVQVFLAEKNFEGCDGLELDDEMRVTIAGTGCVMLLGRDHDLFSEVESILVYPSTIVARDLGRSVFDTSGRVVDQNKVVLGQAVKGGALILAWDSALQGAKDARDGHNVVIHELAHKIDFIDGNADGTPELETYAQREAWAAAMGPAFVAQKARAAKGKRSFLDDYAITNEAEYFAVASETFFEKPKAFAKQLPAVYKALAAFYNLDLAAREQRVVPVKAKPRTPSAKQGADKQKPARGKAGTPVPAPTQPAFRKTAAMAVVALPADLMADAKDAKTTRSPAPSQGKSSAAIVVLAGAETLAGPLRGHGASRRESPAGPQAKVLAGAETLAGPLRGHGASRRESPAGPQAKVPPAESKAPRGKSSAAISIPAAAIEKATRGKSSAAIVPPAESKAPRGKSSAAIAIPAAAIEKATRGKSSAAIVVLPGAETSAGPLRGLGASRRESPAGPQAKVPPAESKPSRGKSSAAIAIPAAAIEKATRGKSSAAIVVPPSKPSRGKSSAAIAIPAAAIEKATRGKSSAAIVVPAVDDEPSRASSKEASAARGKSGARATTPARRTD